MLSHLRLACTHKYIFESSRQKVAFATISGEIRYQGRGTRFSSHPAKRGVKNWKRNIIKMPHCRTSFSGGCSGRCACFLEVESLSFSLSLCLPDALPISVSRCVFIYGVYLIFEFRPWDPCLVLLSPWHWHFDCASAGQACVALRRPRCIYICLFMLQSQHSVHKVHKLWLFIGFVNAGRELCCMRVKIFDFAVQQVRYKPSIKINVQSCTK